MMWGDRCFGSGVIVDSRPEGVAIVLELLALVYMQSMGPLYDATRDW